MRLTKNQRNHLITYMKDTLDKVDIKWLLTLINLSSLSLFEFNRMKKIIPLDISEDLLIIDEFNINDDSMVKDQFNNLLRRYMTYIKKDIINLDDVPNDCLILFSSECHTKQSKHTNKDINDSVSGSRDIIPKLVNFYSSDNAYFSNLTFWHYVFNAKSKLIEKILSRALYIYVKQDITLTFPFLVNKGNAYEFVFNEELMMKLHVKEDEISEIKELAIMMNFLINKGVISWR